jgi:hypothetical protein
MRKKQIGIVRWILLTALLVAGLIELNYAAYSSWASWGPPTKYPRAWAQSALLHLGYSISLLATAAMALAAPRLGYSWRSSKMKYFWVTVLLLGLGYPRIKEFILVDKCLDSGGSWDKQYFECRR